MVQAPEKGGTHVDSTEYWRSRKRFPAEDLDAGAMDTFGHDYEIKGMEHVAVCILFWSVESID
jgi:hypothetical protein